MKRLIWTWSLALVAIGAAIGALAVLICRRLGVL